MREVRTAAGLEPAIEGARAEIVAVAASSPRPPVASSMPPREHQRCGKRYRAAYGRYERLLAS